MNKGNYDEFDKQEDFKKNCQPLLDELILQCSLYKIPFFWSACVANNLKDSVYISDAVGPGSRDIHLTKDYISKFLGILAGCEVVPRREVLEINMEEVFGIPEDED